MQPGEIVWEEPPPAPPDGRNHGMHVAAAAELRQHPKRWARIHVASKSNATTLAHGIRNGVRFAFREGRWEAVARRLAESPDGDWATYARYLGDDEADLTEDTP